MRDSKPARQPFLFARATQVSSGSFGRSWSALISPWDSSASFAVSRNRVISRFAYRELRGVAEPRWSLPRTSRCRGTAPQTAGRQPRTSRRRGAVRWNLRDLQKGGVAAAVSMRLTFGEKRLASPRSFRGVVEPSYRCSPPRTSPHDLSRVSWNRRSLPWHETAQKFRGRTR
jgi:hypothetical protein